MGIAFLYGIDLINFSKYNAAKMLIQKTKIIKIREGIHMVLKIGNRWSISHGEKGMNRPMPMANKINEERIIGQCFLKSVKLRRYRRTGRTPIYAPNAHHPMPCVNGSNRCMY